MAVGSPIWGGLVNTTDAAGAVAGQVSKQTGDIFWVLRSLYCLRLYGTELYYILYIIYCILYIMYYMQ